MKTNGSDPIEPIYAMDGSPCGEREKSYLEGREILSGLTKREYFAAIALQGILANSNYKLVFNPEEVIATCSSDAVVCADTLINELNKIKK